MKKPSRVVEKGSKNVTHIVGILKRLRRETVNKNQFVTHITSRNWLSGGLGLILWEINSLKVFTPIGECVFFLSCRYAEKLCPRKRGEKIITTVLQEAGIITIISEGVKDIKPALYRLENDWVGILPHHFKLNAWQLNRLNVAKRWVRSRVAEKASVLSWVDESLARTMVPETEVLRKVMQDPCTKPATLHALEYLRGYLAPHEIKFSFIGYAGTIYTPIMSLPKTIVPTLLIDGEAVAQLDITSAHPSTLPRMLIDAERKFGIAGAIEEAKMLSEMLASGRFYDLLASEVGGIETHKAKKRFLGALNGEDRHTYNEAVFIAFAKRFPRTKEVIWKIRGGDRKRLNKKMAAILAQAIERAIETCSKHEIPVFPRTDEIVCRQSDAEFVREVLAGYFFDETGVNARVGKERVSFIPTEEYVWEQFSARYDLAKFTNSQIERIENDLPLWNCVKMIRLSKTIQKQPQIAT